MQLKYFVAIFAVQQGAGSALDSNEEEQLIDPALRRLEPPSSFSANPQVDDSQGALKPSRRRVRYDDHDTLDQRSALLFATPLDRFSAAEKLIQDLETIHASGFTSAHTILGNPKLRSASIPPENLHAVTDSHIAEASRTVEAKRPNTKSKRSKTKSKNRESRAKKLSIQDTKNEKSAYEIQLDSFLQTYLEGRAKISDPILCIYYDYAYYVALKSNTPGKQFNTFALPRFKNDGFDGFEFLATIDAYVQQIWKETRSIEGIDAISPKDATFNAETFMKVLRYVSLMKENQNGLLTEYDVVYLSRFFFFKKVTVRLLDWLGEHSDLKDLVPKIRQIYQTAITNAQTRAAAEVLKAPSDTL
ncbi:hypothetical protein CCR75_001341 [Bremia lactucae]|uniref:Uncharacterized protein n=1 Tax=Bremia lactucae TaxID=4779 RepID=A0A976IBK1_BRELC|nr:hypothetical protein CCR75_001341 [Bremia lactucae]